MNKKGFTLIELLAVIVILAVIALIATPAVLNIIEDSKRSSAEDSARIIAKEAETYYMSEGTLQGNEVGDIDLTTNTLNYKGEKPSKGYVTYDEQGNAYLKMYMNGYCVESDYDNSVTSEKTEATDCTMGTITIPLNLNGGTLDVTTLVVKVGSPLGELPTPTREDYIFAGWFTEGDVLVDENTLARENLTLNAKWTKSTLIVTMDDNRAYANGEIVYFNPITNSACSNYTTANSKDLFKGTIDSGCMKWHAFLNSNDDTTIRLILDHNTEAGIPWEDAKTYIANVRDNNTYGWHEEVYPTARMISATEVNQIAPYNSETWTPTTGNSSYYLLTGSSGIYYGAKGTNKYAWLFDNITSCDSYGCNVRQNTSHVGYWTTDAYLGSQSWVVYYNGSLTYNSRTSTSLGIRPVIEVPKDVLSQKKEVTYGETYGEIPTVTREGYTFTGWRTTGGTEVTEASIVEIPEDTTIYAQWQANTYTVTFKKDGEVVSTKTVVYDQPYGTLPSDQVKDGYLFKGWKKDRFTAVTSDTLVTTASNHDIEAILVEKTYLAKLYFNPITNEACRESEYNATTNSADGFRGTASNGCLLWYAYKEDGDNYLMIADHDTSSTTFLSWSKAQVEIADAKDATKNKYGWHEEVRSTIRMISAEEIVEIAPKTSGEWTVNGSTYYFQTWEGRPYTALMGTNKYGWLFDHTFHCDQGACNVSQSKSFGYWTSTVRDNGYIWYVEDSGQFNYAADSNGRGIRPVISVPKSKFTN